MEKPSAITEHSKREIIMLLAIRGYVEGALGRCIEEGSRAAARNWRDDIVLPWPNATTAIPNALAIGISLVIKF